MQPDPTSPLDLDPRSPWNVTVWRDSDGIDWTMEDGRWYIDDEYVDSENCGPHYDTADLAAAHGPLAPRATDNPAAVLAALAEAQRERDEAKAAATAYSQLADRRRNEIWRMRPVVEAAKAWRVAELPPDAHNKVYRALNALAIAVDAFEHPEDAAETQEGTDG